MQEIQLSNGDTLHFPDGMSDDQIHSAIQKEYGSQQSQGDHRTRQDIEKEISDYKARNPASTLNLSGMVPDASWGGSEVNKNPYVRGAMEAEATLPFNLFGGSLLKNIFSNAGIGAGQSAANSYLDNGSLKDISNDAVTGLLTGGALGAAGTGIAKGINALRPTRLLRGNLPEEELKKRLQITSGTTTPLGRVLDLPLLSTQHENILSKIPFSGVQGTMQQNANEITERGSNILKELLGNHDPKNVEGTLNDTLQKVRRDREALKGSLYDKFNEHAESNGFRPDISNFSNKAKDFKEALQGTNILKTEPEFASLMSKLGNYEKPYEEVKSSILNESGKPFTSVKLPTYKEANILSRKLLDLSEKYSNSTNVSERNLTGVFKQLGNTLKNDVKNSVENSNNKELSNLFGTAEKNYAKEYSPLLDKDIHKFANGRNVDPDTIIQSFIKTGKQTDRSTLLGKLVNLLPDSKKNLLGYGYLSRALDKNGNLDPVQFSNLLGKNNLGQRQLETLFPKKEMREKIKNYADLVHMNKEAFDVMRNSKTGARISDWIPTAAATGGYALAGLPGAIAGGIGIPASANLINKAITSPSLREKLISGMLNKNKGKGLNKLLNIGGSAIQPAASNFTSY